MNDELTEENGLKEIAPEKAGAAMTAPTVAEAMRLADLWRFAWKHDETDLAARAALEEYLTKLLQPTEPTSGNDFMFKGDVAKLIARISERYGEKVDSSTYSLKRHPLLLRAIDLLAHPPTSELIIALQRAKEWLQGSEPHRAKYLGEVLDRAVYPPTSEWNDAIEAAADIVATAIIYRDANTLPEIETQIRALRREPR